MKPWFYPVAGRVPPVFDKCCRYIASHSQPLEIQGIRPTFDEFKADFETISKHGIPTSRLRKLRRQVPVNRACTNGPAPRASYHRLFLPDFAALRCNFTARRKGSWPFGKRSLSKERPPCRAHAGRCQTSCPMLLNLLTASAPRSLRAREPGTLSAAITACRSAS